LAPATGITIADGIGASGGRLAFAAKDLAFGLSLGFVGFDAVGDEIEFDRFV
jgi:hypothetical protein